MNYEELVRQMADLADTDIELQISLYDVFILISQIQLALRHPQNNGCSAERARCLCDQLFTLFSPQFREFLGLGYDPQHDI